MSSDKNVLASLFGAWTSVSKMILDGTRKPEDVLRFVQSIVSLPDFISILDAPRSASVSTEPVGGWAAEYTRFYHEVFSLTVDLTGVEIPAEQPGFGWVVMMVQGLTMNQIWAKCKERFPCQSFLGDDLDRAVPTHDRTTATAYAKRFRNRVEADKENANISANALARQKAQSITLPERGVQGLWYEWKTGGGQLDLLNVTLCAGSRGSVGGVPSASWGGGRFGVYYYFPGHADGSLRSRSAV